MGILTRRKLKQLGRCLAGKKDSHERDEKVVHVNLSKRDQSAAVPEAQSHKPILNCLREGKPNHHGGQRPD
jgi:hypothetical protein